MNKEIWKKIEEAPNYSVSNLGRVRMDGRTIIKSNGTITTYKPRIVSASNKNCGYLEVRLILDKNNYIYRLVHRLVLSAFNPIENMNEMEVNHKDENKHNNILENLEWMTSEENCNYGTRNVKCGEAKERKVMCVETNIIYKSFEEASKLTNIDKSSINMCCTGYRNRKTAGGYHWRYVDE